MRRLKVSSELTFPARDNMKFKSLYFLLLVAAAGLSLGVCSTSFLDP
jgi:hypothetical protein